jgi:hypothetical protein
VLIFPNALRLNANASNHSMAMKKATLAPFCRALALAIACLPASLALGQFSPGPADDNINSLGQYRIVVNPAFQPLMAGYPGYDGAGRLTSPVLFDQATVIGRSAPIIEGTPPDTNGTPVGSAMINVADTNFSLIPAGFELAGGTGTRREVHTEVRTLNMSGGGGSAVRAGTAAPDRPKSFGEVESYDPTGAAPLDFPADSFFDIFVDVDIPTGGSFPGATLTNEMPLIVQNTNLTSFPPQVVYIHGSSTAVPILFTNTTASWHAGDVFGVLVLAGHGTFPTNPTPAQVTDFENTMQQTPEMPVTAEYRDWAPFLFVQPAFSNVVQSVGSVQITGAAGQGAPVVLESAFSLGPGPVTWFSNTMTYADDNGNFIFNIPTGPSAPPIQFFRAYSTRTQ